MTSTRYVPGACPAGASLYVIGIIDADDDGTVTAEDDYLAVYNGEQIHVPIGAVTKETNENAVDLTAAVRWWRWWSWSR